MSSQHVLIIFHYLVSQQKQKWLKENEQQQVTITLPGLMRRERAATSDDNIAWTHEKGTSSNKWREHCPASWEGNEQQQVTMTLPGLMRRERAAASDDNIALTHEKGTSSNKWRWHCPASWERNEQQQVTITLPGLMRRRRIIRPKIL